MTPTGMCCNWKSECTNLKQLLIILLAFLFPLPRDIAPANQGETFAPRFWKSEQHQQSTYGKVVVVGALATELVECALNATIPLTTEWQPYSTVVATILQKRPLLTCVSPHQQTQTVFLRLVLGSQQMACPEVMGLGSSHDHDHADPFRTGPVAG